MSNRTLCQPNPRKDVIEVTFHDSRTYKNVGRSKHCLFIDNVGGIIGPIKLCASPTLERMSSR